MSSGSKKTTVGYWYRLLYHFGLVKGPVDAFLEFRAGDRTAWKGELTQSGRISINRANLWGGEKSEGGLEGDMDIMMGEPTQMPNSYLANHLGADQPSYRGKLSAVWRGGRWGAMNPYPKPAAFKVRRILKGWDNDQCWYPEKAVIPLDTPVPVYSLTWTQTKGNAHTFASPSDVSGWSHNPDDYSTEPVGSSISWPTGNGATGIAWLHISAPGGVPSEFHLDIKVNYDDSGKVIGTRGVTIGPATAPPIVSGFPRSQGVRVIVPAHGGPFEGYVAFACVDVRDIETGSSIGSPSNHRMLVSSTAVISSLSGMNPAHILYDSLTAEDMQGEPVAMINEASFRAAADILYSEGLGLCMEYKGEPIDEFQQRICDIIGGSMTQSRVDGQYYLDLIRGDYNLASLPVIEADDIVEFSQEPSVLTEQPNQVTVEWFDPETKSERSTTPLQAMGAIQAAGRVIPETRSYPEIATEKLALQLAGRDLQAFSTPTSRSRLTINRRPFDLRPGRPFRLRYPAEGIGDMVCVLADIDAGTLTDGRIRIVAVQDIYGFPSTVYVASEPGLALPPNVAPVPPPHQFLLEAPYVELVANMSRADLDAFPSDAGVLMTVATRPQSGLNYSIYSAAEGEDYADNGSGEWCPTALIVEPAGYLETAFTLNGGLDLREVEIGTWAMWDSEIVRIDALDVEAGTLVVGRGCADTVPVPHAAGSRIFFCGDWAGTDGLEHVDGDTVRARLLTRTSSDQLAIEDAPELTLALDQRQYRPYPPGRLKLNGLAYPDQISGDVVVTWAARDRVMQADKLIDTTLAGIGPEPNTTWNIRCYANDILDASADGLADAEYAWSPSVSAGIGRVEVRSVRSGVESLYALSAGFLLEEPLPEPAFASVVLGLAPASWLRFGETSGTAAADSSGNNKPGVYPVDASTLTIGGLVSGDSNSAILYPTEVTEITMASPPVNTSGQWAAAWICRPTAAPPQAGVGTLIQVGAGGSSCPEVDVLDAGSGRFRFRVMRSGSAQLFVSASTWAYGIKLIVTVRQTSTAVELYVNGVLEGSSGSRWGSFSGVVRIGCSRFGGTAQYPYIGVMDELQWYGYALAPEQIAELHAASVGGFVQAVAADAPLFWYRLDQVSGTSLADSAGGVSAQLVGTVGADYMLGQPSLVGDQSDRSVQFKGAGYAVSTGVRTLPVANITLMAVVQIDAGAPAGTIVSPHSANTPNTLSGSRDRALYLDSAGKLVAAIWAGSIQIIVSDMGINDGLPHIIHLACGANAAAGSELYIDGVSVGAVPHISTDTAGSRYIQIGRSNYTQWPGGSMNTVQGRICEVAWFNSRLSLASIRAQAEAAGLRGW